MGNKVSNQLRNLNLNCCKADKEDVLDNKTHNFDKIVIEDSISISTLKNQINISQNIQTKANEPNIETEYDLSKLKVLKQKILGDTRANSTNNTNNLQNLNSSRNEMLQNIQNTSYNGGKAQLLYFNFDIIEEINYARMNPQKFAIKIQEIKKKFKKIKSSNSKKESGSLKDYWSLESNETQNISILDAHNAIDQASKEVSKLPPSNQLKYDHQLCLNIPDNYELASDEKQIKLLIESNEYLSQCSNYSFNYVEEIMDPKLSIIMQCIDSSFLMKNTNMDNSCDYIANRRSNIFNSVYRKIGVSHKKFNNSFCMYIVFVG